MLPRGGASAGKPTLKLGVLTDMSGTYSSDTGRGSLACAQQAVDEFDAAGQRILRRGRLGGPSEKPDIGAAIARQWFDRDGVDVIVDVPTSSVALAVNTVVREKSKVFLSPAPATPDLTGKPCSPNTLHWTYDTYMLGRATGEALVKSGGDTLVLHHRRLRVRACVAARHTRFVKEAGGKVLGASAYPFPSTTDFSCFLVRAKASGAKVIGLANAGLDTQNCVKQAHEFGIVSGGTRLAGLLVTSDRRARLGLATAHGLVLTESFYWDLNDRTRAFSQRVLRADAARGLSEHAAGRLLFRDAALSQGGGRHGCCGEGERRGFGDDDEEDARR